jgi:hypothetical protein
MGLFEDLLKKHGNKNKEIQELLEIIQGMEKEALLSEANTRSLIKDNERLYNDLQKCLHSEKPDGAHLDVLFNNNKNQKAMADVVLAIASPKTGIFTLIDNKTQQPIVSPTFSNQAVGANSNPELATFALDGSGNAVGTGIAAGSGTVVFTTDASYTDPGDGSSQTVTGLTVTKNFTVLPAPDGVTFDVVFP